MDFKQIQDLIKMINKSNIGELTIEEKEFKITIKQKKDNVISVSPAPAPVQMMPAIQHQTVPSLPPAEKTVSEVPTEAPLPAFNTETLAQYNGADSSLPIYIAFDGDVYDVTLGRSYYEPGGAYAFLAGTDGTELLSVIGGDIIKKKYPVIGTFTP